VHLHVTFCYHVLMLTKYGFTKHASDHLHTFYKQFDDCALHVTFGHLHNHWFSSPPEIDLSINDYERVSVEIMSRECTHSLLKFDKRINFLLQEMQLAKFSMDWRYHSYSLPPEKLFEMCDRLTNKNSR
jgi:hypothetical protein